MNMKRLTATLGVVGLTAALGLTLGGTALAHCDGLDGPVVEAAQKALETGNVNLVLIWVQKADEKDVRAAFQQAREVRALSAAGKRVADTYFFETVVRLHRTSEGASYTGLKPAGRDLGPAIPAADKAIASGSMASVEKVLVEAMRDGLRAEYAKVAAKKNYDRNDVEAGRQYVKAYVEFIHYVEALYETAAHAAPGHYSESAASHRP
jgi:hypothetical protein